MALLPERPAGYKKDGWNFRGKGHPKDEEEEEAGQEGTPHQHVPDNTKIVQELSKAEIAAETLRLGHTPVPRFRPEQAARLQAELDARLAAATAWQRQDHLQPPPPPAATPAPQPPLPPSPRAETVIHQQERLAEEAHGVVPAWKPPPKTGEPSAPPSLLLSGNASDSDWGKLLQRKTWGVPKDDLEALCDWVMQSQGLKEHMDDFERDPEDAQQLGLNGLEFGGAATVGGAGDGNGSIPLDMLQREELLKVKARLKLAASRFQRNEGLDLQRFDVGMVSEIRGEEECAAHCFCREFVLHRVLNVPDAAGMSNKPKHGYTRFSDDAEKALIELQGKDRDEVCVAFTYQAIEWTCWLKSSGDPSLMKDARPRSTHGIRHHRSSTVTSVLNSWAQDYASHPAPLDPALALPIAKSRASTAGVPPQRE
ncbi:hypothetical protein T484DRAFT_1962735 [Baffinella frigidus]|nr:hypothetical protein T484DRAFT_1962735 [Cryptophyta sp. CCMP2293]